MELWSQTTKAKPRSIGRATGSLGVLQSVLERAHVETVHQLLRLRYCAWHPLNTQTPRLHICLLRLRVPGMRQHAQSPKAQQRLENLGFLFLMFQLHG